MPLRWRGVRSTNANSHDRRRVCAVGVPLEFCALLVKRVHRIEVLSQAARRHGDFHDVRKVTGNGLRVWPAFVASHAATEKDTMTD